MLQAGCIYLGLITPCPEDLPPPAQLQMPSQLKNTPNIPPDKRFPYRFHKPPFKYEASLIPLRLSLVIRPTAAPPCLNKGHLLPLRSSLLFCLSPIYTLQPALSERRGQTGDPRESRHRLLSQQASCEGWSGHPAGPLPLSLGALQFQALA